MSYGREGTSDPRQPSSVREVVGLLRAGAVVSGEGLEDPSLRGEDSGERHGSVRGAASPSERRAGGSELPVEGEEPRDGTSKVRDGAFPEPESVPGERQPSSPRTVRLPKPPRSGASELRPVAGSELRPRASPVRHPSVPPGDELRPAAPGSAERVGVEVDPSDRSPPREGAARAAELSRRGATSCSAGAER